MMRGLFLSVLSMALTLQLTGCSLFSSDKAETEAEATEQVESTDDAVSDSAEEKSTDEGSSGDETAGGDDALFDESSETSASSTEDSAKTDLAQTTEGGGNSDDTAFPETPMDENKTTADTGVKLEDGNSGTLDSGADSGTLDSSSTGDTLSSSSETTPVTTEDVAAAAAETTEVSTPVIPSSAPLKKVESSPFKRGGSLLNRVYLARDGDTWKSVSERIYGKNRSKEFKRWNPFIKRNLKVGDKVYYNSPKAPDDNAQMLTYFEENGITPLTYSAKAGDDLKSVGKQLLGNSRSWMELYATNPNLESKDALPEGTEIKYWGSDALASVAPPAQENPSMAQSPDMANNSVPPADMNGGSNPPTDVAMNGSGEVPPPPPVDPNSAAPVEDPFAQTPPPVDAGSVPPPPPPADLGNPSVDTAPPPPPTDAASEDVAAEGDPNTDYMVIGGAAVLILALIVFIVKRRKKNEIDLGQTQV